MSRAIGKFNGWNVKHYSDAGLGSGLVLPSYQSTLAKKIDECRKYFAHTGRGKTELAAYEKQFVETYGLLKFMIVFDWFTQFPEA